MQRSSRGLLYCFSCEPRQFCACSSLTEGNLPITAALSSSARDKLNTLPPKEEVPDDMLGEEPIIKMDVFQDVTMCTSSNYAIKR